MSRAYVSRVSCGKGQPSIEVAIRIAQLLGKSVEQVFELVEPEGGHGPTMKQFPGAFPSASVESTNPTEKKKVTKGKSI